MKLKVYSIFMEPSSYTLDLVENIHDKLDIDYCFLENSSEAKTNKSKESIFLSEKSFFYKVKFLFTLLKENDLIIMNGYNRVEFILLFLMNFFFLNKRFIALESDTQYKEENNSLKFKIKRLYLSYIFSRSYILGFSGGNFSHKELFRKYNMEDKRIFLAPMMVDNQKFFNPVKNRIETNILKFLYVGRIIPHKNVKFLIESFLKEFKDKEDVILDIVGKGSELNILKNSFEKEKNIFFKGPKYDNDLIKEYHQADVLIVPSLEEPWGLVVNEALSAGLVVITSNKVGANEDLILNKDTGFVFDLENSNDLSQKLAYIYNNKEILNKYSSNARNLMENSWNYNLYKDNLIKAMEYVKNETTN